jgi:hypothetical protein
MPPDLACSFAAADFAYMKIDMMASRRAFILPDRQAFLHFCNAPGSDRPASKSRSFTFGTPTRTLLSLPRRFASQTNNWLQTRESLHERVQTRVDVRILDAFHQ